MESRNTHWLRPLALVSAAAVVLSACKLYLPETDDEGDGEVTFAIQEVPHAPVSRVVLAVEAVELERANGNVREVDLSGNPQTVDLLPADEVADPQARVVFSRESLPAGDYQRLTLVIDTEQSTVTNLAGGTVPVEAAGDGERLDVESNFRLDGEGGEELILTVDLHLGLKEVDGRFELEPGRFVTTDATSGSLLIRQRPPCSELGLYFYEGENQDAAELGATDAPWFTLRPESQRSDVFMPYFPSGEYTVWYTCEADQDSPDSVDGIEFEESENLEVEDGRCSQLEFDGGPGEPGTC
ncbi:DUF4382 domain-containing protein [Aquisalimonas sp. 2447]|uniref:DUF4382 domain-containing protein n=1 Tax=Aquisalimonas sp. 2447 TaxID=2740807 RepID=UPI001432453F|nr:DUF4382 domain-containing protein [Aquisalimonas sp. 2447]QIT54310.1 DUF4382 domain-containing protein [Aquisalimonas sp. 2447]